MSHEPFAFRPSGSVEFEQLEPADVARELHAPVDDPLDTDPLSINFGRRKDHKPTTSERMLSGAAIDWLLAFPPANRPKALCDRFPHVANRLAQDWAHEPGSTQGLKALASDDRWGTVGFPVQVQIELLRVLTHLADSRL